MKQILYTLMVFCAFGLLSCRKSADNFTIKQYDADQIQQYKNNNGLNAMLRDTVGGDTTGIYYQIITPGNGDPILPSTLVSFVYSAKTFDGAYSSTDTILNHVNTYGGYVSPNGLQLAIKDVAQKYGAKIRVLIPSRLMYGINGTTLSSYNTAGTLVYSTIGGNQCFDYTINVINTHTTVIVNNTKVVNSKQPDYDDLSIKKYLSANGLQYIQTPSGLWYRITQAGTTGSPTIGIGSTVGVQYTGTVLDGIVFDQANTTDGTAGATFYGLYDITPGFQEALLLPTVTNGAKLSIIVPSRLGYGQSPQTGGAFTIPGFSCLRFDVNIISVNN